jgi:hypothetical protein
MEPPGNVADPVGSSMGTGSDTEARKLFQSASVHELCARL